MTSIRILSFTFFLLIPLFSFSQETTPGSVEYLQQLVNSFDEMEGAKWKYLKAVTRGRSARKVEKRRNKLISEFTEALKNTRKVRSFKNDTLLKPALIEYLQLTKTILKEDYDKILDMEAIAEESYDDMEAYIMIQEQTDAKLLKAANILEQGQTGFAELYNINIVEGERSKRAIKIQKASDALAHYNQVFLIFFKSNILEANFLNAMSVGDVVAMDQNANALMAASTAGLDELSEVTLIMNDLALVNGAKNVLKFYQREVESDFKQILDFYLVEDAFKKANKEFEAIRKNKRTQADVDKINKASKKYNLGVNKINTTIERNNNQRNTTLNNWNKVTSSFFDRHS